jgi:hypothetical protein
VLTLTVGCLALMRACAGAAQASAAHAISRATAPIGTRRAGLRRAARPGATPCAVTVPYGIASEDVDGAAVTNETDEAAHGARRRTRKDRKACVMNGRKTKESRAEARRSARCTHVGHTRGVTAARSKTSSSCARLFSLVRVAMWPLVFRARWRAAQKRSL